MEIRAAQANDWPAIWSIFAPILQREDAYSLSASTHEAVAREFWMEGKRALKVAELEGRVVGSAYLKPANPGLADHTANAGFIVGEAARGRGVAAALCEAMEAEARAQGFRAMQFSFVVATNPAVKLWTRLGYATVGRIPLAFRHGKYGPTDALIMWKNLQPEDLSTHV